MKNKELEEIKEKIEKAGKDLFDYAVDREDIKYLLGRIPENADIKLHTVEYELQILKIISTGWTVRFHLKDHPYKTLVTEVFWYNIYKFAEEISSSTKLLAGTDINYFDVVKERLDLYIDGMLKKFEKKSSNPLVDKDPAVIVGNQFAKLCGNDDEIFTAFTGGKLFASVLRKVESYFENYSFSGS